MGRHMALQIPAQFPPIVILPGFGNDARDCEWTSPAFLNIGNHRGNLSVKIDSHRTL